MFSVIFNFACTVVMLFMGFVSKMRGDIANEIWFCAMALFFLVITLHHVHTKS